MTSAVIGGALAQWPLGFLSDKLGRRKVLAGAAAVCGMIGLLVVTMVGSATFVGINLLGAAWGFVAFPLYAIAVAHANDYAEPDDYVMLSSGLLLMYGAGAIIGPFIASALITFTDATSLYAYTGAVHIGLTLFLVVRILRRESAPVEHHMAFSDALATAHTASQVYEEEIHHLAEEEH